MHLFENIDQVKLLRKKYLHKEGTVHETMFIYVRVQWALNCTVLWIRIRHLLARSDPATDPTPDPYA